jgi:hypothetical protein
METRNNLTYWNAGGGGKEPIPFPLRSLRYYRMQTANHVHVTILFQYNERADHWTLTGGLRGPVVLTISPK